MMTHSFIGRQAVVVGAGIGGLGAAAALANHFEQVTVLERTELPSTVIPRTGTPQDKHLHGLLTGGLRAFGALLPGIGDDLQRAGSVRVRVGADVRSEFPGCDALPPPDHDWAIYSLSRPLLDSTLRRRIEQKTNVTFRQNCRGLEILREGEAPAAAGIRYETAQGKHETLAADLVVDASSSGALTLAFLRAIGRPLPAETVIGVDIGYATANYVIPDDAAPDWKGAATFPLAPESSRTGYFIRLEDRWILTLSGRHGDKPPVDPDAFLDYVQSLRTPTIYNVIRHAKRQGDILRYGFQESRWRHFERLDSFPRGLLPIGDAICRFNPVYGQGMSVAGQEAHLLDDLLRERAADSDPLKGLGASFLAGAGILIESPWALSALPDFIYPETRGERPADFADAINFSVALQKIAFRDPAICGLFLEVQHLLQPHTALQDPALVQRVKAELAAAA